MLNQFAKFKLTGRPVHYESMVLLLVMKRPYPGMKGKGGEKICLHRSNFHHEERKT